MPDSSASTPSRLMVGGDSAGGNLAAVVAIARARRQRPRDRRPGADLSRHRFRDDASLAQRARDQHPADAFGHQMVSRSLSQQRSRRQRLARLAGARHDAGRPAAGLRADRRRRSVARRRRRICRAPQASRRGRDLPDTFPASSTASSPWASCCRRPTSPPARSAPG